LGEISLLNILDQAKHKSANWLFFFSYVFNDKINFQLKDQEPPAGLVFANFRNE
jgi:hypothetical protein